MLGGRRYETFDSAEAYGEFRERSWKSLTLAEPLVRRHGLRLAVENHKDYRTDELLDVLGRLASPHVGVCVDTGNNLALLEPVESTVAQLAPWAVSCHLKDMAVEETSEGFLLSEVPLGQGMLDLAGIVQTLTRANPQLQFSLEMITRDPLVVPCLQEFYWRTLNDVPGGELAGMVRLVRAHPPRRSLPRITGKTVEEQLQFEDRNVIESLQHAREHLGL
jgi:sugar phosphate isomerase/epimerase